MAMDREMLAMPALDDDALDDFAPRFEQRAGEAAPIATATPTRAEEVRRAVDAVSQCPSRDPSADGQLNLKGPRHVLDRFRTMCKADRRAYYDMLEILMDRFESRGA